MENGDAFSLGHHNVERALFVPGVTIQYEKRDNGSIVKNAIVMIDSKESK